MSSFRAYGGPLHGMVLNITDGAQSVAYGALTPAKTVYTVQSYRYEGRDVNVLVHEFLSPLDVCDIMQHLPPWMEG
jgi:hypothetical protein